VRPDELFASEDNGNRVAAVVATDVRRHEVTVDGEADTEGAAHLARWARMALFGREQQLCEDQSRLAGNMAPDLAASVARGCRAALAELHGPWDVVQHLEGSAGKRYYEPRPRGYDEALAQPGQPVDRDHGYRLAEARIAAALEALRAQPLPRMANLEDQLARQSKADTEAYLAVLQRRDGYFTAAIALRELAHDDHYRVDGRIVDPAAVGDVLGAHARAPLTLPPLPSTVITWRGLRITFEPVPAERAGRDARVVAVVDAAGQQDPPAPSAGSLRS
jgi:hypothetical protein